MATLDSLTFAAIFSRGDRMRFKVFATDYDGTFAHHGRAEEQTIAAVERIRATGRKTFLVTGREIEDLRLTFSRFDIFDVIVAENGALLHYPGSGEIQLLHDPPPARFVDELRAAGVTPLSIGHVIVATMEPHDTTVLRVIKELGLELEIIFNKGAVMVLPTGINKATGLKAALRACGLGPEETVGVGDAENDHAFLASCGCGVAVSNALPSLKEHADIVTLQPHGEGVAALIDRLIATGLEDISLHARPRSRQNPGMLAGLGVQPPSAP
jgi:hydroxymethylpyrimidine pyrophosphatase-like HAD family hydrolase